MARVDLDRLSGLGDDHRCFADQRRLRVGPAGLELGPCEALAQSDSDDVDVHDLDVHLVEASAIFAVVRRVVALGDRPQRLGRHATGRNGTRSS